MKSIALAALAFATAVGGDPQPLPRGHFVVHCGTLHAGDGSVLRSAWLEIRDGKVASIRTGATRPRELGDELPVLDASDRVVMPGLIAAATQLAGHREVPQQATPDHVALDGFDFLASQRRALSGGVTTVYLSPGANRLVPGQGSVVKLWGRDIVARVLESHAALVVTLGKESTAAPALFDPTPAPTDEEPLASAIVQWPSARFSQLHELRRLFAMATNGEATSAVDYTNDENDASLQPLRQVASGQLRLRIVAREAQDVRRALELARSLGTSVVLEDPYELHKLGTQDAGGKLAVFRMPIAPGRSNPGGEDRGDRSFRPDPAAAGLAAAQGAVVAIAPADDEDLRDLLLLAGLAVRHGLAPDQALSAVTSNAARVLGIEERVGTLAPGRDADFLVLTGEPLAIGTMVERTFVDGELAYEREAKGQMLALVVGKALPASGPAVPDAVILIENGRIKAIGQGLPIPFGAEVRRIAGGVATPGFVDAFSHAGLAGDGVPVPNGAPDQAVAQAVQADDPSLRDAARSGLTTLLVSGKDGGLVSGRVAAVKTLPQDGAVRVLRETAAVRFVHDAIGAEAIKPLADAIQRGRQYRDAWLRYEKAVADWKAGKREKPKEAPPPEAPKEDPITGVWELTVENSQIPVPLTITARLTLEGTAVTGEVRIKFGQREMPPAKVETGIFENGKLTLEIQGGFGGRNLRIEATVTNDKLEGSLVGGMGDGSPVRGTRTEKDPTAGGSTANASGEPVKPRLDESLEPIRALLDQKIPAVVRVDRGPAIRAVADWFAEQKLRLVLHGAEDAALDGEVLAGKQPAIVVGPEVLTEEDGQLHNLPARLTEAGATVALGTGDAGGTRHLPVHAALAVRYGLDPQEALRALTLHPARMFGLDDRIGSLERGKDADVVVFSGDPFEITSRVELVVVDGQVAYQRRAEESR